MLLKLPMHFISFRECDQWTRLHDVVDSHIKAMLHCGANDAFGSWMLSCGMWPARYSLCRCDRHQKKFGLVLVHSSLPTKSHILYQAHTIYLLCSCIISLDAVLLCKIISTIFLQLEHSCFIPRCMEFCPSVTRVNCDKKVERSVQIYIPYERTFSLVFWEEGWLVGATLLPKILGQPAPIGAKLLILNR